MAYAISVIEVCLRQLSDLGLLFRLTQIILCHLSDLARVAISVIEVSSGQQGDLW